MEIIVFEHEEYGGLGRLAPILRDYGHRLRVIRLWDGDVLPSDLDEIEAVISLGGRMNIRDAAGYPWMREEMNLLREAHEREAPVIGLCLGSQLIAAALGGEVDELDGGPELGWHEVKLAFPGTVDTIFAGLPWRSMQFNWHQFHVKELPPGATALAASERTRTQAWRAGVRTYGFQYHFELDRETMLAWAERYPDELRRAGLSRAELEEQTREFYEPFSRLADRLSMSIAEYLIAPVLRKLV